MFISVSLQRIYLSLLLCFAVTLHADVRSTLVIDEEIEIDIARIGKPAKVTLIWFACNQGDETAEIIAARKLAEQGYQIYFPDMLTAHFLSPTPSSIASIGNKELSRVAEHIIENTTANQVVLVGAAQGAIPVLKILSSENIKSNNKLLGALLITPRINDKTPEPGSEPVYIEEVGLSSHPIRVLEGERTPNRWGLPHLAKTLAKSGSEVSTDLIKGVRGFFYLRLDKTDQEQKMSEQLDQIIDENLIKMGVKQP